MANSDKWPEIKWANGYFYFQHGGRRYTALGQSQISTLLRATMAPLSIHNKFAAVR